MRDFPTTLKLGILGGGQLGKMMCLATGNWHLPVYILDEDEEYPAAPYCHQLMPGSFRHYSDVYRFGKMVDVLTIEIEHVHIGALKALQDGGLKIHPHPDALEIIKDKGLQKRFYINKGLPTSTFQLYDDAIAMREAVRLGTVSLPFVQKTRTAGYDGKGVMVIRTPEDLQHKLVDTPSVIEPLVAIDKELAIIACRNERGEIKTYDAVEMVFNPEANLVELLCCPARIAPEIEAKAREIAIQTIEGYQICGLLAVEFFLTTCGEILINEVAPRPHNSGHHTIDSCVTSQFEQHVRGVLNLPLGDTRSHSAAVMVNVLGAEGYQGAVHYEGLEDVMALPGVHVHLYGKKNTKPFRKMGHITVTASKLETALDIAAKVQNTLRVISKA